MRWFTTAENVARKLSDMAPAPTFWCKLGIHKYPGWTIYKHSERTWLHDGLHRAYEEHFIFKCSCVYCNKVKFKKTKTPRIFL